LAALPFHDALDFEKRDFGPTFFFAKKFPPLRAAFFQARDSGESTSAPKKPSRNPASHDPWVPLPTLHFPLHVLVCDFSSTIWGTAGDPFVFSVKASSALLVVAGFLELERRGAYLFRVQFFDGSRVGFHQSLKFQESKECLRGAPQASFGVAPPSAIFSSRGGLFRRLRFPRAPLLVPCVRNQI